MLLTGKGFSQTVGWHLIGWDPRYLDAAVLSKLAEPMAMDIHVLELSD